MMVGSQRQVERIPTGISRHNVVLHVSIHYAINLAFDR